MIPYVFFTKIIPCTVFNASLQNIQVMSNKQPKKGLVLLYIDKNDRASLVGHFTCMASPLLPL